ncbi:MAG: hypothetical protein PHQ28_00415 [Mycobacterium sp.]|nr:hypothetical protein [Mycobacterium sp.]
MTTTAGPQLGRSDPAAAAWIAAGCPAVDAPTARKGRCGRCGTDAPTVSSWHAVSDKFAAFDGWPYGVDRLCLACAWAYSRAPNTQPALHITATSVTEHIDSTGLLGLLCAGPLPNDHAVVVPATRRQHILPCAQWGYLATDGFVTRWDPAAAQRLTDLAWLRETLAKTGGGGGWARLSAPAPPPWLLRSQPAAQWPGILDAWEQLRPWRDLPALWAAARRLTNACA